MPLIPTMKRELHSNQASPHIFTLTGDQVFILRLKIQETAIKKVNEFLTTPRSPIQNQPDSQKIRNDGDSVSVISGVETPLKKEANGIILGHIDPHQKEKNLEVNERKNEDDEEFSEDFSQKLHEHSEYKESATSRSSRGNTYNY